MDVFEAIEKRRSIRKFKDAPVEFDKVVRIIESALKAPSAGNIQDWKFVVVLNKDSIEKLSDACYQQGFISTAPVVIVVCSQVEKAKQLYGVRGERLYTIQDSAACVENILLSVTALDLGATWVGAFEEYKVQEILSIPESVRPQAIIPIGYPGEKPQALKKYNLADVFYFDKWGNKIKDSRDFSGWFTTKVESAIEQGKNIILDLVKK